MQPKFRRADVLDLLLNRDNPRHVRKENQEEIIAYLLEDEEVYNLARHISQKGINPLEVAAIFSGEDGSLTVAEGNRRVCAAQLLTDPGKAPEGVRARYRALAAKSVDVSQINVAEFDNYEAAQPWLQILHDGEQDGVGRRRWKPEQKARSTTSKSNDALAVALLDYAENLGILDSTGRQDVQVSTATRYLANPAVRRAMGLTSLATSEQVTIATDEERFTNVLSNFFEGIRSKRLHSRSVSVDWLNYANDLEANFGPAEARSQNSVISPSSGSRRTVRRTRARIVPPETRYIDPSAKLVEGLNRLGQFKLSNLYHSLTTIRLDENPVLLTSGAWVFVETLTALHGRN